jgi:high-affinity iron transporter
MFEVILPSFMISFRESLEAALIIAIMVSYLKKIGKKELDRYAYIGSVMAIVLSLFIGIGIQTIYGGLDKLASELFEGFASLTAVVVLTYMIFWMTSHSKEIRGELEERIDISVGKGELYGIASLAFVAVVREGLETVLFLSSTYFQDASGTILGTVLGISVVLLLSALIIRESYQLDLKKFFGYTSILLIVFAAGLAGYGTHELIEAGERMGIDFGFFGEKPFDINPPVNPDGSFPLLHEKGVVGSILKALIGYDGNPEWLRIIVYIGYWVSIGFYLRARNLTSFLPTTQ